MTYKYTVLLAREDSDDCSDTYLAHVEASNRNHASFVELLELEKASQR